MKLLQLTAMSIRPSVYSQQGNTKASWTKVLCHESEVYWLLSAALLLLYSNTESQIYQITISSAAASVSEKHMCNHHLQLLSMETYWHQIILSLSSTKSDNIWSFHWSQWYELNPIRIFIGEDRQLQDAIFRIKKSQRIYLKRMLF